MHHTNPNNNNNKNNGDATMLAYRLAHVPVRRNQQRTTTRPMLT